MQVCLNYTLFLFETYKVCFCILYNNFIVTAVSEINIVRMNHNIENDCWFEYILGTNRPRNLVCLDKWNLESHLDFWAKIIATCKCKTHCWLNCSWYTSFVFCVGTNICGTVRDTKFVQASWTSWRGVATFIVKQYYIRCPLVHPPHVFYSACNYKVSQWNCKSSLLNQYLDERCLSLNIHHRYNYVKRSI